MIGSPFLMLSLTISSVSGEVELKLFSFHFKKQPASFLTLTMRGSDHHSCCSYQNHHPPDYPFLRSLSEHGDWEVLTKILSAVWGRNWLLRMGKHWRWGSLWRREKCFSAGQIFQYLVQRSAMTQNSGLHRSKYCSGKTRKISKENETRACWHKSGIFLTDSPWGRCFG